MPHMFGVTLDDAAFARLHELADASHLTIHEVAADLLAEALASGQQNKPAPGCPCGAMQPHLCSCRMSTDTTRGGMSIDDDQWRSE